jgi:hypothetical protein
MGRVLLNLAGCIFGILIIATGIQKFLIPNATSWQIGHGCIRIVIGLAFIYNCSMSLIRGTPKDDTAPTT